MRIQSVDPADVKRLLGTAAAIAGLGREAGRSIRRAIRHSNPLVSGVEENIDQPFYDSFSLAAGAAFARITLFQQQIGNGGKTLAQTNMTAQGQLPFPQRLELHSIVVVFVGTTYTDVENIMTNVSFTLTVNTKPYLQVPPLFLPAGCGPMINAVSQVGTAPTGAQVAYSVTNGVPDPRAVFALSCPFVIESGESFNVTLNPETPFNLQANTTNPPGLGTTMYVKLDGVLYRGVS